MATLKNTLNLWTQTDATVVTSALTAAGGNQMTTAGATSSIMTVSSTTSPHATKSVKFVPASGDTRILIWQGFTDTDTAGRGYFYFTAYPGVGNSLIFGAIVNTGGTAIAQLQMNASGDVGAYCQGGSSSTTVVAAGVLPLNTWVWFDLRVHVGTNATTGQVWSDWGVGDAPASNSVTVAACNTGTTTVANIQLGKFSGTHAQTFYMADTTVINGTTTSVGPFRQNPNPIVTRQALRRAANW